MNHIVTITDIHYLHYALTLYQSLKYTSKERFLLHFYCIDQESYDKVKNLRYHDLKPYKPEFLNGPELDRINSYPKLPNGLSEFHWALSSLFMYYVSKNLVCEDRPKLMYCDSDVMFYNDVNDISQAFNKDIGMITHKHMKFDPKNIGVGYFNVGIFMVQKDGYEALKIWSECVSNKNNPYAKKYGGCGDQGYLNLLWDMFKTRVQVLDHDIGHFAPWSAKMILECNQDSYIIHDKEENIFENKPMEQKLYFYHYSHFNPDYKRGIYQCDREGEWHNIIAHAPFVKEMYDKIYIHTFSQKLFLESVR